MKSFLISYFSPFYLLWRIVLITPGFYGLFFSISSGGLPYIPIGMSLSSIIFYMGRNGMLPRRLEFYGTMLSPWLLASVVISGSDVQLGVPSYVTVGLMSGISYMVALRPWGMGPNIHDINDKVFNSS